MKTDAHCRNCDSIVSVVRRKSRTIKVWIKHWFTGKKVFILINSKATTQKFAAITGVPCPKCGSHKLERC